MQYKEDSNEEIRMATALLCEAYEQINDSGDTVDELFRISGARYGLCTAAKCLYKLIIEKSIRRTEEVKQLFKAAVKFCSESSKRTIYPK